MSENTKILDHTQEGFDFFGGPLDLMDSGSSGRYNLPIPQRSAGGSRVDEKYHLHEKQGHVTSSSFGASRNIRFERKSNYTSPDLPEIKGKHKKQQIIRINQPEDLSEDLRIFKERTSETVAYGSVNQSRRNFLVSSPEGNECLLCFPPLGVCTTDTTYTMGNKNSSSRTCTCKVEDQEDHVKSRSSKISKKGRKSKSSSSNESKGNPIMNESLSDVFQNLKIGSNDIQATEVPRHVLYYAWFFDPEVALSLKTIAHSFLTECLLVNQFERFIQSLLSTHRIQDPLQLYKKPGKRKPDDKLEYHVTAKFCDRQHCLPYQENVQPFIGSKFKLHIVGLCITEKTFGFRVKLTAAQKALFDERKTSDVCTKPSVKESISHKYDFRWEEIAKLNALEMAEDKGKDPKCKSDIHKSYPGITLVRQKEDFHPTDSRAHITIGCAQFVKAFQTGEDLVDILDLEMRPAVFHQDFQIQGATLRQFGRNATAFVIYPHHEVIAEATFNIFR